jgi:hypothetical protein
VGVALLVVGVLRGGYGGLRIITLRNDEGLLVGLMPLMLRRNRLGLGQLMFLATGVSD